MSNEEENSKPSTLAASLAAVVMLLLWAALLPAFVHVLINVASWSWNLV